MTSYQNTVQTALDRFFQSLRSLRVGRASSALVEDVVVEAYGSKMRLVEVASIQVPQADQILIQVWDADVVSAVEKALLTANLNLNPVVEGNVIRLALPALTYERRQEVVRQVKKLGEDTRIILRNIRETEMESIEKQFKQKDISEDDKFRQRKAVQEAIDKVNEEVQQAVASKEEDIMKG